MTPTSEIAAAFNFLGFVAIEQVCEVVDADMAPDQEDRGTTYTWDWRISAPETAEVLFGLEITPSGEVPERLKVLLVGRFRFPSSISREALARFAQVNAPATLLPYIREAVSSLSSRGPFGQYHIDLLNVVKLSEGFRHEEATGWKQMEDHPELLTKNTSQDNGNP